MPTTPTKKVTSPEEPKSDGSPSSESGRTGRGTGTTSAWTVNSFNSAVRALSPNSQRMWNIFAVLGSSSFSDTTDSSNVPDTSNAPHSVNPRSDVSAMQSKADAEALAMSVRRVLEEAWSKTDETQQKSFNVKMPRLPSHDRSPPPECWWYWDMQGSDSIVRWVSLDEYGKPVFKPLLKDLGHPGFLMIQTVIGNMGGPIANRVTTRLDRPQSLKLGSRHFVAKCCRTDLMVVNGTRHTWLAIGFTPASPAEMEDALVA
jgi:hypothetical protein